MRLFRSAGIALSIILSLPVVSVTGQNLNAVRSGDSLEPSRHCVVRADSIRVDQALHADLGQGEAYIWYLLHSGFAVKTKSRLLIFDDVGAYLNDRDTAAVRGLSTGWVDPAKSAIWMSMCL